MSKSPVCENWEDVDNFDSDKDLKGISKPKNKQLDLSVGPVKILQRPQVVMESNSFVPPQHVLNKRPASPPIKMKILKRPEQKEKVEDSTKNQHLNIKTYAQREEHYNRVRERIMGKQQDNGPITTQIDHKVDNLQASNSQGGFRTHNNNRRNNRNRGNKNRNNQGNHGNKKGGRNVKIITKSNGSSPTQLLNNKLR